MVTIQILSDPPGADVVDEGTGRLLGRTPLQLTVPPSSTPRRYRLRRDGYVDLAVELVADKDVQYTALLAKRSQDVKPNPYKAPGAGGDLMPNPF
jgi:hypothetical protein